MIIVGYQGIGKSTLAGKNKCIDLESGNFWVNGERDKNWYKPYCQIANHLSEQGFIVFVSSHEVVRNELKNSKQDVYIVYPSIELEDEWISKLQKRYDVSGLEKDYKALMNAKDRYIENIQELQACALDNSNNIHGYEITKMDYDLSMIIDFLMGAFG